MSFKNSHESCAASKPWKKLEETESEKERKRRLRIERAARLKALARGTNRGGGLPLEILAAWPPAFAVAVLGLPPRVLVDELQRERSELSRLNEIGPLTLSGR